MIKSTKDPARQTTIQVERRLIQRIVDYIGAKYSDGSNDDFRLREGDDPLLDELYTDVKRALTN